MNRDIFFKFGTEIEDVPLLHRKYKTTPMWAWPGSLDLIYKFWDPSVTYERIEQYASNLVMT